MHNIIKHNRKAWNQQAAIGCRWSTPVSEQEVLAVKAKETCPNIFLSSGKAVPISWVQQMQGKKVLLLAGGGGQQSVLLSAFGCQVTVYDLSDEQLRRDQAMAEKYNLVAFKIQQGDAADLSIFSDSEFDFIVNPISNCFFPDLQKVWSECFRVLKSGGKLMYGFVNPHLYLFDFEKANRNIFEIKYSMPYSDIESLSEDEKKKYLSKQDPLEFGHSLGSQIGLLCKNGFLIEEFLEDRDLDLYENAKFMPSYFNTLAKKK